MVEFNARQVNTEDKALKGLQNRGIVNFDCAYCHTRLLVLQLTAVENAPSVDVLTRVAVKCCRCGGFSCAQQIPGQFHPGAPSDGTAFDILDDDTGAPEADILFKAWSK